MEVAVGVPPESDLETRIPAQIVYLGGGRGREWGRKPGKGSSHNTQLGLRAARGHGEQGRAGPGSHESSGASLSSPAFGDIASA